MLIFTSLYFTFSLHLSFLYLSFTPLGSSGFAERTRPCQSTTETLRMHPRVFSSTSQRQRETHVGCAWVLLHTSGSSSKNISSSGHSMCPLPYKQMRGNPNWPHRAGTEAAHHMNVLFRLSIRCGNVSLWSSKLFDVSVLSPLVTFTFILSFLPPA